MVGRELARIEGVVIANLKVHADLRGSFTETFRESWFQGSHTFVQSNVSHSRRNVLRGLHFHLRQSDYWHFINGKAFVVLLDLRKDSPTSRAAMELRVDADTAATGIYIPPGVAHGYYAVTDLRLLYQVDEYYTGDDEFGVLWNDPDLALGWPSDEPTLSERDSANPPLRVVLAAPPPYSP